MVVVGGGALLPDGISAGIVGSGGVGRRPRRCLQRRSPSTQGQMSGMYRVRRRTPPPGDTERYQSSPLGASTPVVPRSRPRAPTPAPPGAAACPLTHDFESAARCSLPNVTVVCHRWGGGQRADAVSVSSGREGVSGPGCVLLVPGSGWGMAAGAVARRNEQYDPRRPSSTDLGVR